MNQVRLYLQHNESLTEMYLFLPLSCSQNVVRDAVVKWSEDELSLLDDCLLHHFTLWRKRNLMYIVLKKQNKKRYF